MATQALRFILLLLLASQLLQSVTPEPSAVPAVPIETPVEVRANAVSARNPTTAGGAAEMAVAPEVQFSLAAGHEGADRELIEWAVGRFELVDLELPEVEIVIDADHEQCGWRHGRFLGGDDGLQIILCLEHTESYEAQLHRRRTLVHELAHAWDYHHFTDRDRERLLPTLEAATWYGTDTEWEDLGAERFAETLVWGLSEHRRRPVLIDVTCDELHRDFVVVTGRRALGSIEGVCEVEER